MKKSFKATVQAMTAKEIIMAMVEALKKPYYKIDMNDYGCSKNIEGKPICFGCAATNTISRISGVIFTPKNINWSGRVNALTNGIIDSEQGEYLNKEVGFLDKFESAIDYLRKGDIWFYNNIAEIYGIAIISDDLYMGLSLPRLENNYTTKELEEYIKLAELQ